MNPKYAYTKPEMILFHALQKRGIKFSSQFPILIKKHKKHVIVDFLIGDKLVVEVDGIIHFKSKARIKKDEIKDKALRSKGYSILRVTDKEIFENIDKVIEKIENKLKRLKLK